MKEEEILEHIFHDWTKAHYKQYQSKEDCAIERANSIAKGYFKLLRVLMENKVIDDFQMKELIESTKL